MWTPADPDLLIRYADAWPALFCDVIVRLIEANASALATDHPYGMVFRLEEGIPTGVLVAAGDVPTDEDRRAFWFDLERWSCRELTPPEGPNPMESVADETRRMFAELGVPAGKRGKVAGGWLLEAVWTGRIQQVCVEAGFTPMLQVLQTDAAGARVAWTATEVAALNDDWDDPALVADLEALRAGDSHSHEEKPADPPDDTAVIESLADALAGLVRASAEQLDGATPYAAALTHCQFGALRLTMNCREWAGDDLETAPPDEAEGYWWPDEWDFDSPDDPTLTRVGDELCAWWGDAPSEAQERKRAKRCQRILEGGLGSAQVREAFRSLGADPILVVVDVDDDWSEAPKTLKRLNPGRKDPLFRRAQEYWKAQADSE